MFVLKLIHLLGWIAITFGTMSLRDIWLNPFQTELIDKWLEYADVYEAKLMKFHVNGQQLKILEIGVQSGGSIFAWKKWFSSSGVILTYVGIDINPLCKQLDAPTDGIHIEIGSQDDPIFLRYVCDKYGPFDIIIDDGGHTAAQMMISLRTLFPYLESSEGVYVIEDTHTFAVGDESSYFEGMTISQHVNHLYEDMHSYWKDANAITSDKFTERNQNNEHIFEKKIKEITMRDSMIVLDKQSQQQPLTHVQRGHKYIPVTGVATYPLQLIVAGDVAQAQHDFQKGPIHISSFSEQQRLSIKTKKIIFEVFVGQNNLEIQEDSIREHADKFCSKHDLQITDCAEYFTTQAIQQVYSGRIDPPVPVLDPAV